MGRLACAHCSDAIPDELVDVSEATMEAVAGGMHPFTGPINNQDGSVWLAEGETPENETLLGMNFFVEGIEGVLPN